MQLHVQAVIMLTALAVYHAQVSDICMHLAAVRQVNATPFTVV